MQFSEQVLAKNHQFCIINKLAGQPVQPDKTGDISILDMCKKYFHHNLYLIHRIDRPVSGLVILAKNTKAAAWLSELFKSREINKSYLALVEGQMPQQSGTLVHQINNKGKYNKSNISNPDDEEMKDAAVTNYQVLGKTEKYTLLHLQPLTGRHHQIRAQLAAVGCPIQGDVKYGARRGNKDRSISLHAWKLSFVHPVNNEATSFEAPLPSTNLWQGCLNIINS
ncbi:MAG: RNA pseudouridine synthase [Saprospiraceae bacterium]|nr:RNA pseudouridine synthase [Saprospiraceae bacterium]